MTSHVFWADPPEKKARGLCPQHEENEHELPSVEMIGLQSDKRTQFFKIDREEATANPTDTL